MVALKVTLPNLHLVSRNSSPSRSPATPSSALAVSSAGVFPSSAASDLPLTLSGATPGPMRADLPPEALAASMPTTESAAGAATATEVKEARPRQASFGALGAVLRRSASGGGVNAVAASTPINPVDVRSSETLMLPPDRPSSTATPARPASDSATGLPALRRHHAASNSTKARARSSERRPILSAVVPSVGTTMVPIQHSVSQPPLGRTGPTLPIGKTAGKKSPVQTPSGTLTPAGGRAPALHNLEESYVGKVSLRLGEAVNKVFLPGPSIGAGDVVWKCRTAPKVARAQEVGDVVVKELQAAVHDVYLMRTLLRSSILKALSLFLTRLTALLLPSDAVGSPPLTLKEADAMATPLRFNLQIVRCACVLKNSLILAGVGAPAFVHETLKPWIEKLAEVMARVMNPLITSVRVVVSGVCAKARIAETASTTNVADMTVHPSSAVGVSSAGSFSASAAGTLKQGSAQLRSLSMGRTHASTTPLSPAGPAWLRELFAVLEATVRMVSRLECGADADKWLVSVITHAVWKGMLSLSARRIVDEESTATLSVGTANGAAHQSNHHLPTTVKSSFFKSSKRTVSPGDSPPLLPIGTPLHGAQGSHVNPAASDVAFIRLLCELELLESRLASFRSTLSAAPLVDPHAIMSGTCDATAGCGLCKTGRTFDAESSDEEDEADIAAAGGLAQYAMREAMQALSAMIIVVRASAKAESLKEALLYDAGGGLSDTFSKTGIKDGGGDLVDPLLPLTPMDLLKVHEPSPAKPLSSASAEPVCPTLLHALDTLPTLILLHLLASRLPPSFRLPHELWRLDWRGYEKELRTFAAGEEWTAEVGWEMAGEVKRCLEAHEWTTSKEKQSFELLSFVIRTKVGDVGDA